jgi:hypothetical protein
MSKTWKVLLGAIVIALVVAWVAAPIAGRIVTNDNVGVFNPIRRASAAHFILASLTGLLFFVLIVGLPIFLFSYPAYSMVEVIETGADRSPDDLSEEEIIAAMRRRGITKLELADDVDN